MMIGYRLFIKNVVTRSYHLATVSWQKLLVGNNGQNKSISPHHHGFPKVKTTFFVPE